MKKGEKLSHGNRGRRAGGYSSYWKNRIRRSIRRVEKLDPENAPTKTPYYGTS